MADDEVQRWLRAAGKAVWREERKARRCPCGRPIPPSEFAKGSRLASRQGAMFCSTTCAARYGEPPEEKP